MKAPQASPKDIRDRFTVRLEDSKRSLSAERGSLDGPNKRLAASIRISPSRVGEFLNSKFWIKVAEEVEGDVHGEKQLKLFEETRIRKAVSGFAASAHRTLSWLRTNGWLGDSDAFTTADVVKAYWPEALLREFNRASVTDGIADGQRAATAEAINLDKINIELWVVNWGPFSTHEKEGADEPKDFFTSFGTALVRGIDPIDSDVHPKTKTFDDLLSLPPPDPRKPRALGIGPFETLDRRFRGFRFVAIPALKIPLAGLLVSAHQNETKKPRSKKPSRSDFEELFDPKRLTKRVVMRREVGDFVLSSVLPKKIRDDTSRVEALSSQDLRDISAALVEAAEAAEDKSVIFVSDAVAAFEIFARLTKEAKEEVRVEAISQWDKHHTDLLDRQFVFAPAIMLRDEDSALAKLLEDSQRQFFKSYWRVEDTFLEPLFEGIEDWLTTKIRVTKDAISHWPDHSPVFIFPRDDLDAYLGSVVHQVAREELIGKLCGWIDQRFDKFGQGATLRKLFKISPKP